MSLDVAEEPLLLILESAQSPGRRSLACWMALRWLGRKVSGKSICKPTPLQH
ncbi:unnamed protein product [Linum tenue]|uniref:Uncharacterized protein n=1 Tax=Linum tenue TaxID=586396 RepID=A0AAV0S0W9_9ROSI|nr:unnamed protein product [Linum tenue]